MPNLSKLLIPFVFIFAALYLFYLAAISQTIIFYDAIGYQELGRLITDHGLDEYFRQGPNREALYPLFVSISMQLAKIFNISYQPVLLVMQVLVLLFSLYLLHKLLTYMRLSQGWQAVVLIYTATSPAIIFTSFIVWSEILTYPFVLFIILTSINAWKTSQECDKKPLICLSHGALLGLSMFGLTLIKAVAEMASVFIIVPWIVNILYFWRGQNKHRAVTSIYIIIGFVLLYWPLIFAYKWTNYTHNGQFTLTNRASWALYGNSARRMAPLNAQQWKAAFASIPHEDDCQRILKDADACAYWTFSASDKLGIDAEDKLHQKGLNPKETNKQLLSMSLNALAQNPFQALTLMGVEGMKFIFWEYNARPDYVVYPQLIQQWYQSSVMHIFWKYGMALFTFVSLILGIIFVWQRRRILWDANNNQLTEVSAVFFMLYFILLFVFFYSFFYCSGRYAMPLAPLFLALIIHAIKRTFHK